MTGEDDHITNLADKDSSRPALDDVTFIFATIHRPACVRRLITSVRHYYPSLKIAVADQNPPDPKMEEFYQRNGVMVRYVPFDTGVSGSRSSLLELVDTKYILYGDDDFIFTQHTNLALPRDFLEVHADFGLVGGNMMDLRVAEDGSVIKSRRRFEKILSFCPEQRGVISTPIDYVHPKTFLFKDRLFYQCDMTLNWALCRSEIFADPNLRWDPEFKISGEHENFFFQLKLRSAWRIAYSPELLCDHKHEHFEHYEILRSRTEGWISLGKKWDIDWMLDIGSGLRYFSDFESPIPYTATSGASAQQTPNINRDFLRVWHCGHASASVSFTQQLKTARERAGAASATAQRRIQGLSERIERLAANNAKALERNERLVEQNQQLKKRIEKIQKRTAV